jgi:hypothetical protein
MTEIEPIQDATPIPRGPSRDAVYQLRVALTAMEDDAKALAEAGDWQSLIRGLEPLQQIIGDLRIIERSVKNWIADTIPERKVTVPGVGTVERKAQITRRNWQSDDLLRKIVVQALVDPDTGEIPSSPMEAVERVLSEIRACVPFTGSTGWRVGALRERGFDPDEWCEENLNGFTIQFSRDRSNG